MAENKTIEERLAEAEALLLELRGQAAEGLQKANTYTKPIQKDWLKVGRTVAKTVSKGYNKHRKIVPYLIGALVLAAGVWILISVHQHDLAAREAAEQRAARLEEQLLQAKRKDSLNTIGTQIDSTLFIYDAGRIEDDVKAGARKATLNNIKQPAIQTHEKLNADSAIPNSELHSMVTDLTED